MMHAHHRTVTCIQLAELQPHSGINPLSPLLSIYDTNIRIASANTVQAKLSAHQTIPSPFYAHESRRITSFITFILSRNKRNRREITPTLLKRSVFKSIKWGFDRSFLFPENYAAGVDGMTLKQHADSKQ